jgi:hypothetical protein
MTENLLDLPSEVLGAILMHLTPSSRVAARLASRVLRACVDQRVEKLRIKLPADDTAAEAAAVARRLAGSELRPTSLHLELAQAATQPPMSEHTVGAAFLNPQLSSALGRVRELTLTHLPPSPTLMAAVLAHMAGSLVRVEVAGIEFWSQQALEGWAMHLPQLRSVQVQLAPTMEDPRSFWEPLSACRSLTALNVGHAGDVIHYLAPLTGLTSLSRLSLSFGWANNFSLQSLPQLTQLTYLSLKVIFAMDRLTWLCAPLTGLVQLRELELGAGAPSPFSLLLPDLPSLTRLTLSCQQCLRELRLPQTVRELVLCTPIMYPAALKGLTPSQAPALQRIAVLRRDGSRQPLRIRGLSGTEDQAMSALEQSVDAGALRLISSVCLQGGGALAAICLTALGVLRRSWKVLGQAPPPVMELVLENMHCPRAVLELLPAGLTNVHLHECRLELDSLTPVARQLPRLRVLGLDASVSAGALRELLTTAKQRDALTVHVWGMSAVETLGAQQLSAEEVASISALAAAGLAPQPMPRVVWHSCDERGSATYAASEGGLS